MADEELKHTTSTEVTAAQHAEPASAEPGPLGAMERIAIQDKVIEVLRTCYDPEIPVNIYELGLVYDVKVEPTGAVNVRMTLTSPACPVAGSLPGEVQAKIKTIPNITAADVEVVWEPPWDPSKMSEAARLQLGMF